MLETTEEDKKYNSLKNKQESSEKAKNVLRGAGYARGGGVSPVKAVHKHESHLHKGEKKTKFKHGGKIEGAKSAMRADKYKRGGHVPKGHHTKIAINVGAGEAEKKQALQTGVQLGARLAAAKMAGAPRPIAGAPMQARPAPMPAPGGMPGGPPGAMPPPPMKRGGKAKGVPHLTGGFGSGGGKGRLAKQAAYGTKPKA